jgi:ABC-2 type transport system ATP-binding protein
VIEVDAVSKSYANRAALQDVSFTVKPGRVTGFLGPNGAGKSTTLRIVLGLESPDRGSTRVLGRAYAEHTDPIRVVGALLDAGWVSPTRSAGNHLRWIAASHGIPSTRIDQVLDETGLLSVENKRVGAFSLGMRQRLGIAAALLGDPSVLILDEPVNGLDPEGVLWLRELLRARAAAGCTVFLSSHLMSEMALVADYLVVLGQGRVLADGASEEIIAASAANSVTVRTPDPTALEMALAQAGFAVAATSDGSLQVAGASATQVGDIAYEAGVRLHELVSVSPALEDVYFALTGEHTDYRSGSRE